MKTLKVLLQEVVSGIKAWVNSNFAQESNTVHKTGDETINGVKTFTGSVHQNKAGGTNVYCATCDGVVKGDLTSSGMFSIVCKDGSNANMETSGLAAVYMGQDTSGSYATLRVDTTYNNTRYNAAVSLDIDPTTANNNAIFRPRRDNTIDLGSSSYQFKNLYANNYYYNGTAWGLDQANVWNTYQTIKGYYLGNEQSTNGRTCLYLTSNRDTVGQSGIYITKFRQNKVQGGLQPADLHYLAIDVLENSVRTNSVLNLNITGWNNDVPNGVVLSSVFANAQLGSSSYKWKTLNGVNPGALSFPNIVANPNNANPPTGYISIDTTNWDLTNYTINWYTTPTDGWVLIAGGADSIQIDGGVIHYGVTNTKGADGFCESFLPVPAGCKIQIRLKNCTNLSSAYFFPCLGNV